MAAPVETSARQAEEAIRALAEATGFTPTEIENILHRFDLPSVEHRMSKITFQQILVAEFDLDEPVIMQNIWRVFDRDNSGFITAAEFVDKLWIYLRGSEEEKREHCFKVYDINGQGYITLAEMQTLLRDTMLSGIHDDIEEHTLNLKTLMDLTLIKLSGVSAAQASSSSSKAASLKIYPDTYERAVDAEPLLLECFGQCLPSAEVVERLNAEISQ